MEAASTEVDEQKLEQFMGQAVTDMGAAMNGALVMIGGELGIWEAMAGQGPLTSAQIAERSSVEERYVREWASAQAASGYLEYDADADAFTLPPEQAMALADPDSPVYVVGGYSVVSSIYKDREKIAKRFREGEGFGWHEHHSELFVGHRAVLVAGYKAHLVDEWLSCARGRRGETQSGWHRRRYRLRPRDLDDSHGPGVQRVHDPWVRLPRRLDRAGEGDRRERGGRGQHRVRRCVGEGLPGRGL